ncbi:Uncharacterised protein [Mycobacteroides abscessus subsp. abscessus]|nr:Uncharacterised protein [Mycobacteroides abscessus subsp. abscessus]
MEDRRRQKQIDPRGQRDVAILQTQALTCEVDRHQRRRAGRVDGHRRPAQVEEVGQAIGDDAQRSAEVVPRVDAWKIGGGQETVLTDARTDEDARRRPLQRPRSDSGILQCLPGGFEKQALLRVHLCGFARGDLEEVGVESGDVVEEGAVPRRRLQSPAHFGGAVVEAFPAFGGNRTDSIAAR